jgi:hypothetical protein
VGARHRFAERGRRTDEAFRMLHDLWSDRAELTSWPAGAGERIGPIPILVGGSSRAATKPQRAWATGGTRPTWCRRSSRTLSPTTVSCALKPAVRRGARSRTSSRPSSSSVRVRRAGRERHRRRGRSAGRPTPRPARRR